MECFHGVLGKDPPLDPSAQWQGKEADLIGQSLPGTVPLEEKERQGENGAVLKLTDWMYGPVETDIC